MTRPGGGGDREERLEKPITPDWHSPTTSPSLLERVRDPADAEAWREFDQRYGELIVRYAHRIGLQLTDAEDVRQNVLLKLAQALPEFRYDPSRGRFRHYLSRIARNEVFRHVRCPGTKPVEVDTDARIASQEVAVPLPDATWEEEWIDHHLRLAMRIVRKSCDSQSLSIFERLLAGGNVEDVAREFGVSAAAVHKVKQRIRDRLKTLIETQIRDENEFR